MFWVRSYDIAKSFPAKPPMGDYTSRYEEHFRLVASWPFFYKYYLYKPDGYDRRQEYPLVVLLHGSSRHMHGGRYILADEIRKKHPSFVLVPIAPDRMSWGSTLHRPKHDARPLAMDALRAVQRKYSIDSDRIYVSGYSMGGVGTFAIVEQYPHVFAAALVLCGTWDPQRANLFPSNVPILLAAGSEDESAQAEAFIAALKQQGKSASFLEYPGVGHNVWDHVYPDLRMWDWLYSQRR